MRPITILRRFFSQIKSKSLDPKISDELPTFQYAAGSHKRKRIYVWGNAMTGALGVPYKKGKENLERIEFYKSPKRLFFAEKFEVLKVGCGFGYTLFSVNTEEGTELYGTGLNSDGQIGYHEVRVNKPLGVIYFPQPIFLPFKNKMESQIKKIAAGRTHTAILSNEGLFLFGNNAYGQCGRDVVDDEKYAGSKFINHIKDFDNIKIIDVECGQDSTLVLLEDGSVYATGWGADGQTGLGHYDSVAKFMKVKGDIENEKIVKLSCKSDFTLALNDRNQVFGWGNAEYAQISLPNNLQQIANPTYIKMCEDIKVIDVSAGGSFCMVLDENGSVFVWGFGLLGTGPQVQSSIVPILIPDILFGKNDFSPETKVVQISSGLSHMGAVNSFGDLYTWGRNRDSCLGLGHSKDQPFPLKVAIGASVENVCCGLDHTIALCKSYLSKT